MRPDRVWRRSYVDQVLADAIAAAVEVFDTWHDQDALIEAFEDASSGRVRWRVSCATRRG